MSMYLSCKAMLVAAGVGQLILCSASLAIPRVLRWPEDLARFGRDPAGLLDLCRLHLGHESVLRADLDTRPGLAAGPDSRWPGPSAVSSRSIGGHGW